MKKGNLILKNNLQMQKNRISLFDNHNKPIFINWNIYVNICDILTNLFIHFIIV